MLSLRSASRLRRRTLLAAGAICLLAVAGVWSAVSSRAPAAPAAQPETAANAQATGATAAGMRVAIQPESGDLVPPSPEQAAELDALAGTPKATEPPRVEVLPDGTVLVDTRGRLESYSVARIGADGRIETGCTPDVDAAKRFLNGQPAIPQPKQEVR
jgi:glucose/arabinose dehydrogenase